MELVFAALLLAGVGTLHSVLGERYLLGPLFAIERWPHRAISERFARRTLRFAWHLTTLAWWCWAAILAVPAAHPVLVIAAGLALTAAIVGVASRGAHFAWPLFALASAGALAGGIGARALADAVALPLGAGGAILLALLGALHVYWVLGGRRGLGAVLPSDPRRGGAPVFRPGPFATCVVAIGLMGASAALLAALGLVHWPLPASTARGIAWALAAVFALRLVGDFRWVGLFKRVRGTTFARFDDALYTPSCFFIALASAAAAAA